MDVSECEKLDHTLNLVRILDKGQLIAAPPIREQIGRRVADRHGTAYNLASYVISISVTTGNCPERTMWARYGGEISSWLCVRHSGGGGMVSDCDDKAPWPTSRLSERNDSDPVCREDRKKRRKCSFSETSGHQRYYPRKILSIKFEGHEAIHTANDFFTGRNTAMSVGCMQGRAGSSGIVGSFNIGRYVSPEGQQANAFHTEDAINASCCDVWPIKNWTEKHDGACLGNTGGGNGNKSNTQKRVGIRALSRVARTTARGNDTER
ncbi:hypothetical protein EV421DRAFT_1730407 [Armillaria borealis]|uniref:Uncharacterized protein n=1 Tax=Armillaria borealis TaxID=47425 RepID=A0AA39N138_9AGAR|nr:hypothetical protein EV421DRAFT_1730407 [Armillaria borealis]